MTSTITIEKRVCISSKYLDKGILDHLAKKFEDTLTNTCTKEHGHILSVNKIVKVLNNKVSPFNADNVFIIEIEVDTVKPEIDKEFIGTICMISKTGIFILVKNCQKILITKKSLGEYTLTDEIYSKKGRTLKLGDSITARVTGMQYNKQNFDCFGELVEEPLKDKILKTKCPNSKC